MRTELFLADIGRLICDGADLGFVEYSVTVSRITPTASSTGGGWITGSEATLAACGGSQTAEIASRHFGRIMVQVHQVDERRARFEIVDASVVLGIDPLESPGLVGPTDQPSATPGSTGATAELGWGRGRY